MMRIVKDVPGEALWLADEETSQSSPSGSRILFSALRAVAWLTPIPFLAALLAGEDWHLDDVRVMDGLFVFTVVWYVLLIAMTVFFRRVARSSGHRIEADRAGGELEMELGGILRGRRRVKVRLAELTSLLVETYASGTSAELPLAIHAKGKDGRKERFTCSVIGLNTREEASDLRFRLATIAGLRWWTERPGSLDGTVFEASMTQTPSAQAVPPVTAPASYREAPIEASSEEVPSEVPPFDPASGLGGSRVEKWDPGHLVCLCERFKAGCVSAALIPIAVLGAWVWWQVHLAMTHSSLVAVAFASFALLGAVLCALCLWVLGTAMATSRWVFDWDAREVRHRCGRDRTRIPFADVTELEVTRRTVG